MPSERTAESVANLRQQYFVDKKATTVSLAKNNGNLLLSLSFTNCVLTNYRTDY